MKMKHGWMMICLLVAISLLTSFAGFVAAKEENKTSGTVVVGNSDTKRYHLPGMPYYNKVEKYHRVYFDSEQEAIEKGYYKAGTGKDLKRKDAARQEIKEEPGKRSPYNSVTIGYCTDIDGGGAASTKKGELCASFRLASVMIGAEGVQRDVVLSETNLDKALKNGMGDRVNGFTQAQQMMQSFRK